MIAKELASNDKGQLKNAQTKLEQITAYENHLRAKLAEEDSETIELGRKQLAIQDIRDQLNLTKDLYETADILAKQHPGCGVIEATRTPITLFDTQTR